MLHSNERGNSLIIFAISLPIFIAVAAVSIDGGMMLFSKVELRNAVDAAALAGSSGLLIDLATARSRAVVVGSANSVLSSPVAIAQEDVTFPTASQIRIDGSHTVQLFFAPVVGLEETVIRVTTIAQLSSITGSDGVASWAMPASQLSYGAQVTLSVGELGASPGGLTTLYAVCYPPVNRGTPQSGASAYEQNLINGSEMVVYVGDELLVQPGNMTGPTIQAIDAIINSDPDAYWDGTVVAGSDFPGFSSPRILKIAFFDPADPPGMGRDTVFVTGLGAFFLEGRQGQDVVGRFIKILTSGVTGGSSMGLYSVRLIS